ncbi:MAG: ABC transporter ATP-binding protein [Anaerolineae bacterium]|nr:ABC transporter ATP-binding protein [Anaerolineae bacterium]
MSVSLKNVSKVFQTGEQTLHALSPITLDIPSGEFVCVIGPSGCGKSTFLRLMADQLTASSGTIKINSLSPRDIRQKKGTAWMAQHPALLPWKTVRDNIRIARTINPAANQDAVSYKQLVHMIDLDDFELAYPDTLSGGMQQRVALARTLAIGANLWLMDEPFAALDEFTREVLADEVIELWTAFHPTVIWVTHSIMEAVRLADRVIVMSHRPGRIKNDISIELPRPRSISQPGVLMLIQQLRGLLNP